MARVMAVDPGSKFCGWAIATDGNLINSGVIKPKGKTVPQRLLNLQNQLIELLTVHSKALDYVYKEDILFVNKKWNIQRMFTLIKAHGIVEVVAESFGFPVKPVDRKLARKQTAVASFIARYPEFKNEPLSVDRAEAILWAGYYSRQIIQGTPGG